MTVAEDSRVQKRGEGGGRLENERAAIVQWLTDHPHTDPKTNVQFPTRLLLVPNKKLKKEIQGAVATRTQAHSRGNSVEA